MNRLKFLSTVSVEEFKAQQGITKHDIFRNENTGKSFTAWGNENGAVYAKHTIDPDKEQVVSEVETSTGETFFLLHNK